MVRFQTCAGFCGRRKRTVFAVSIAASLAGLGATVAVAARASSSTPTASTSVAANDNGAWGQGVASSPDAADAAAFAILTRPAAASDAVPADESVGLPEGSFVGLFGANLELSRAATGFTSGGAWVVPGSGAMCLVADSMYAPGASLRTLEGGAACVTDARALRGGLEFTVHNEDNAGYETLAGFVPNGVQQVTAELGGGETVQLPVFDNVYLGHIAGAASAVTFTDASGTTITQST